jgi:hypothetical protein
VRRSVLVVAGVGYAPPKSIDVVVADPEEREGHAFGVGHVGA